jgi:signal transduction histidine kinase
MDQRGTRLVAQAGGGLLRIDPDLVQSLLINLVDNASKASEPGQEVILSQERNVIRVRDFGKGIPAEAISKITEPFFMVDKSRNKKYGGSGLGMALAKRIADAHQASIEVNSKEGEGTVMTVRFREEDWSEGKQLPAAES